MTRSWSRLLLAFRERVTRLTVLAVAVAGALLVLGAGPAVAHSDSATMGIEVTPGDAPLTARIRVLLEYTSDGHPAPGASVSAGATGPDGATVPATPLADVGEGGYEAVLTLPSAGRWTVSVRATSPAADASATVDVVAPADASSGDPDGTATTDPDDVRTSSDRASRDEQSSSSDGPSPVLLAAVALGLVAAAGVTFVLVRRR